MGIRERQKKGLKFEFLAAGKLANIFEEREEGGRGGWKGQREENADGKFVDDTRVRDNGNFWAATYNTASKTRVWGLREKEGWDEQQGMRVSERAVGSLYGRHDNQRSLKLCFYWFQAANNVQECGCFATFFPSHSLPLFLLFLSPSSSSSFSKFTSFSPPSSPFHSIFLSLQLLHNSTNCFLFFTPKPYVSANRHNENLSLSKNNNYFSFSYFSPLLSLLAEKQTQKTIFFLHSSLNKFLPLIFTIYLLWE